MSWKVKSVLRRFFRDFCGFREFLGECENIGQKVEDLLNLIMNYVSSYINFYLFIEGEPFGTKKVL